MKDITEEIVNFKTGEKCRLVSSENPEQINEKDIAKIVKICNQRAVYDFLFVERCSGKPYTEADAKGFVQWAAEGWRDQKWFVFLIRNSQDEIVGCIDIKSNNLEMAEIGYWADMNFPGIMTNAAKKVVELATKNGFKNIYATTRPDNERSQMVLLRNGFVRDGEMQKPNGLRYKFVRKLVN